MTNLQKKKLLLYFIFCYFLIKNQLFINYEIFNLTNIIILKKFWHYII